MNAATIDRILAEATHAASAARDAAEAGEWAEADLLTTAADVLVTTASDALDQLAGGAPC